MRIFIVEDEPPIARDIAHCCRQILGKQIDSLEIAHSLEAAREYLTDKTVDLLLLDLNLNGRNGYELLRDAMAGSFHTIIISAHTDQAVEAFQYGVLDFLAKPFDENRLRQAFDRYFGRIQRSGVDTQFLSVRRRKENIILSINDVLYFKAADYYVEAVLHDGNTELLDKSLDRIGQILPSHFIRIHRSYIVDIRQIVSFTPLKRGSSCITLRNAQNLPLSRSRYKVLREKLNL